VALPAEFMPLADIEIWRTAKIPIVKYGKGAAVVAAQRADVQRAAGDVEGLKA
jgi:hypothetical protein